MDGAPIETTANADFQALGTGGQLAVQAWNQITNHLHRSRGVDHAALFAEPNPDPDRGTTDWYAEGRGPALLLENVAEPEREAVRATLTRLVDEVRTESETLRASSRSSDRFLGDLLSLSLQIPDENCVRVLDGRPVLVAWGHRPSNAPARPELLLGMLLKPSGRQRESNTPPMRIVGPPPSISLINNRSNWMFAALLLPLLLLLLLWLDPFDWLHAPTLQCNVNPVTAPLLAELRQGQARESVLRAEVARLTMQLGDRRVACAPAPARSVPPPQIGNSDAERAQNSGAHTGQVQVILAWDDQNDIDLMVICPSGQRIFYNSRRACGGELDLDQNLQPPYTTHAVENIVFADRPAPGIYGVRVMHSVQHTPGPRVTAFRVTVRLQGEPDRLYSGNVVANDEVTVSTFEIGSR